MRLNEASMDKVCYLWDIRLFEFLF
jgi:hypothetical protein